MRVSVWHRAVWHGLARQGASLGVNKSKGSLTRHGESGCGGVRNGEYRQGKVYKKRGRMSQAPDPKSKRKAKMNVATNVKESIVIENVGPISRLEIPIPDGGGVVVLRGQCGQGKTHAIQSVAALHDQGARKALRVSDGWPTGQIYGLGVTVRLGRTNVGRGELICESLESGVDPSLLVDPGLKDPIAADSRRLATLVRLAAIEVPTERWVQLADKYADDIAVKDLVSDDPVKTADAIRRRLHDYALKQERIGESKSSEAATLAKSVADVDLNCDEAALAKAVDAVNEELVAARTKQQAFLDAAGKYQAAKAKLAETKAGLRSVDELMKQVDEAVSSQARSLEDHLTCLTSVQHLEQQLTLERERLKSARESVARCDAALAQCKTDLETARAQHADIAELERLVAAQLPDSVPETIIADLYARRATALEAVKQGEVVKRARTTIERAKALETEANATLAQAEEIRTIARSTDHVLEQALVDAGYDTIRVLDGRLCVISDRGHEPVSELSTGERWELALDIAARSLPSGGLLSVHQEGWQALDPGLRDKVAAMAKERGLVIITAQVDAGQLRAEVV